MKWPNDIYAHQVKRGGILCQSEYHNSFFSVPTEFQAACCNVYEPMEKVLLEKGFEPFMTSYFAPWLHTDEPVQVAHDDEPNGEKVLAR
ncbi:hypothetical protein PsorP6_012468 [Peronosclerospora sorghi]|uniref:Uncharacterized protein n=1 Tax=Peronosclerospora sorghi TaxID=230839 RepID=A0ACC0WGF6_9STRA|nr:hypothetical protein PsorP6_012468 [Peronosclerospora sorghi]